MRKLIVVITLLYTAAAAAALGFLSNWFPRDWRSDNRPS